MFKSNKKKKKKKKKGAALSNRHCSNYARTNLEDTDFFPGFIRDFCSQGEKEFDGTVPIKEMTSMLGSRAIKRAQAETSLLDKLVHQAAPKVYRMSTLESIHYLDNLSGRRLTEKYRQRLPGVFPSATEECETIRRLKGIFSCVFLPRRTPSGWKIDLQRLIEVLGFNTTSLTRTLNTGRSTVMEGKSQNDTAPSSVLTYSTTRLCCMGLISRARMIYTLFNSSITTIPGTP